MSIPPSSGMNLVRTRAYGAANMATHTFVNGSKDANDAAILQERLLELCTEGKRWNDLRRFGKVNQFVPSMANAQPFKFLFPIGTAVISLEPKVEENPGWKL